MAGLIWEAGCSLEGPVLELHLVTVEVEGHLAHTGLHLLLGGIVPDLEQLVVCIVTPDAQHAHEVVLHTLLLVGPHMW